MLKRNEHLREPAPREFAENVISSKGRQRSVYCLHRDERKLAAISSELRAYGARRAFVEAFAIRVDLEKMYAGLGRYNPRIVHQALCLFMIESNRASSMEDSSYRVPSYCKRYSRAFVSSFGVNYAGARATQPLVMPVD
jgi:hypothetical protein